MASEIVQVVLEKVRATVKMHCSDKVCYNKELVQLRHAQTAHSERMQKCNPMALSYSPLSSFYAFAVHVLLFSSGEDNVGGRARGSLQTPLDV